jgi:hypothetical protein
VKKQTQNNQGSSSASSKAPANASNSGASTKLRSAPAGGAPGMVGTMGSVSNKNPFPKGLA